MADQDDKKKKEKSDLTNTVDISDRTIIVTRKVETEEQEKVRKLEPWLIQISGKETGQQFNLAGKEKIGIGRDPQCQIALDDPTVSRNHAEIVCKGEQNIVIRDLGSTNGVYVNGKKIKEEPLHDGDKVLIGTRLYFKLAYQDTVDETYQRNIFKAANIDGLTQLYNKKYFFDALPKEFSFARREKKPLSILMMDIDYFKKINDTYGHIAGDAVLQTIGKYLKETVRLENIACRFGGEEFVILLKNCTPDQAYFVAERIRQNIEKAKVKTKGGEITITISIGIATYDGKNYDTFDDVMQAADQNLYKAKESGRNRTVYKKVA